ncbi:acyltransferase family protein [Bradyrhizobium sp. USDA 4508]
MEFDKYRSDIDGLRAIAVLSVMVFHYGGFLPGGFTGVDVFFVISGFLITSKIAEEIGQGTFSVVSFYDRRIRRIMPALFVMLAVTLFAGKFLLMPGDYKSLSTSAATAAFGVSNLYFLGNTGYFDRTSDLLPLLHTWSLAVEEQFYVVWPALLLFITATRRRADAAAITAGLTILVFGASLIYCSADPKGAFYMAAPRAWELSIGALLVFLRPLPGMLGAPAKIVGLAVIAYGFLYVSADHFPDAAALYPCIGAALVLWPCDRSDAAARWLGKLAPVGLISYSLYLWHWPIWVYYRVYINSGQPRIREALALAAISILIAALSYLFVERPFRKPRLTPARNVQAGLAASLAIFCGAMFLHSYNGFPERIPPTAQMMQSLDEMWEWPCNDGYVRFPWMTYDSCRFGVPWKTASHKAFLWGDSHAKHISPLLDAVAGDRISFTLYGDCPASLGEHVKRPWPDYQWAKNYDEHCTDLRNKAISYLAQNPDIELVIFAASWRNLAFHIQQDGAYPKTTTPVEMIAFGLQSLIPQLAAPNRRFLIIADIPQFLHDPVPCALVGMTPLWRRDCGPTGKQIETSAFRDYQDAVYQALVSVAKARDDVDIVLPGDEMCKHEYCLSSLDGEFLYMDASHIRRNLKLPTRIDLAGLIGLTAALHSVGRTEASATGN